MKPLLFSFFLILCWFSSPAQKVDFELDYEVEYWAPKSKDTIKIAIGKDGRYLYTDSEVVAKSFGSITRRFQPAKGKEDADLKLLFDMETTFMLMDIKIGQNTVIANVDLSQFMNRGGLVDSTETGYLKASPTALKVDNNGKKYKLFAVAPDSKPEDIIYMAFDEKYPVDYNQYFSRMISMATGERINIDLPKGVLVYVEDKKGDVMLELISVKKKKQKGSADLQLKLE